MPLVWLSKFTKTPLPERVAGCDVVYDFCRLSHQKGYKLFFLGGAPGVADIAKEKLQVQYPHVQVVGTYSPEPSELSDPVASQQIVETINASGADVLMVALGAPKQEFWLAQHRNNLQAKILIPCGGSIDFIAGVQPKSPQWIGKLGLEWLYRLGTNPGKFFDRYLVKDLPFLFAYTSDVLLTKQKKFRVLVGLNFTHKTG